MRFVASYGFISVWPSCFDPLLFDICCMQNVFSECDHSQIMMICSHTTHWQGDGQYLKIDWLCYQDDWSLFSLYFILRLSYNTALFFSCIFFCIFVDILEFLLSTCSSKSKEPNIVNIFTPNASQLTLGEMQGTPTLDKLSAHRRVVLNPLLKNKQLDMTY